VGIDAINGSFGDALGALRELNGKRTKKKARRTGDAPSNKRYGNCLLGVHCSQIDPAGTRANA
jgi:hypothetical protein